MLWRLPVKRSAGGVNSQDKDNSTPLYSSFGLWKPRNHAIDTQLLCRRKCLWSPGRHPIQWLHVAQASRYRVANPSSEVWRWPPGTDDKSTPLCSNAPECGMHESWQFRMSHCAITMLLDKDAGINAPDCQADVLWPLHKVSRFLAGVDAMGPLVKCCIMLGTKITAPFHEVSKRQWLDIMQLLLNYNVDVNVASNHTCPIPTYLSPS